MSEFLLITLKAALEAGKIILKIYKNEIIDIEIKPDNSPVTKADLAANEVIMNYLSSTGIPVLSEEGRTIPFDERKNWDRLWIVDPLDGTKEFIKKNGEFTVNIALIENGTPVLGVVYAPVLNEIYFGSEEKGAFKADTGIHRTVDEILSSAQKLPLPNTRSNYRIVASRSHPSAETLQFIQQVEQQQHKVELVSRGSSLKLCMVAEGSADCYPRFAPTMEWDTAAGHAVCKYAGAEVIDYKTKKPMIYNRENLLNNWFIVQPRTSSKA